MNRHETGQLWEYAGGSLAPGDAARVEAHLRECLACELALEEVKAARSLVSAAPVPPLAPERWGKIDRAVAAAAKRTLEKPRWFALLFGPPGFGVAALAAAALLLFVLWPRPRPVEAPIAVVPPAVKPAAVKPPEPAPPEVAPAPAPVLARVVSVRGASALAANAPVRPGSTVSTPRKGELWLALPDGSRAGVLGDSQLTLAQLEPSSLRLELERGAVVVDATHLAGRSFEVHAGEVDIRVSGTRFLVERIDGRVLVAVSEGSVEVAAGERLYVVPAGRKLTVDKGAPKQSKLGPRDEDELGRLAPLPRREPKPAPVQAVVHPVVKTPEPTPPAATATDAGVPSEQTAPAPVAGVDAGSESDAEFAAWPGPHTKPPPVVVLDAGTEDDGLGDGGEPNVIERLLALANIESPFPPPGMSMEEHRLRQIQRLADRGECKRALERVDAWLEGYEDDSTPRRAELRRKAQLTQARCLSKLGRQNAADTVRRDAGS